MKLKITEGVNQYDGTAMFYVYECRDGETETWHYAWGDKDLEKCRAFVERRKNPTAEKLIEEHEV